MTQEAEIGFGTLVKIAADTTASAATVTLGGVKSVKIPDWQRGTTDATRLSQADRAKHYIGQLTDSGDLEIVVFWGVGENTDTILETLKGERSSRFIEISFPQLPSPYPAFQFRALLTGAAPTIDAEDPLTQTLTFKVSGAVTVTHITGA